ncbi:MAG TPA: DEAD/DEAH box helicase [Chthoniobacterales bacterium]
MSLAFQTSLGEIDWFPRPRLTPLRRLGIETVEDLLRHYPRRHEDRREFAGFPREETDIPICLCGEVTKTRILRFGGWKKIFEVTLEESDAHALSQPIILRWFNVHYVQKMIVTGQRLVVFGKPRQRAKRLCLEHPEFEVIENDEEISIHFRRIAPIYPATEGLSQRVLRGLIYRLLAECKSAVVATLRELHFPGSWESLDEARETLVFEEFFALQMHIAARRAQARTRSGAVHCGEGKLLARFLDSLPFALTSAQLRVIEEVRADLASKLPMNRLLQGDVGSGKTVVAIAAMLLAIEAGEQAAIMAPTQILAEQHYAVLQRWLEPLGVAVALRTGARKEDPLPLFAAASRPSPGRTGCHPVVPESFSGTEASQTRYGKRHLPHFERPWAKYAVTFSTLGKQPLTPAARDVVLEALLHWNERRYQLYAACVMPDHVHVLLEPAIKKTAKDNGAIFFSLGEIFRSIKANTARVINKLAGTRGKVWEEEWFDRVIRSERDLQEKFRYITRNPFDAGLEKDGPYPWVWFPGRSEAQTADERRADCTPRRGDTPSSPEAEARAHLAQIFVGTHALLFEPEGLKNPGLVVIDEQHKFGVAQRGRLTTQEPAPDVLVMTATPIPRTLTMTLYGDLDVSTIDEMPADRGRIVTAARDEAKLPDVLAFLRRELEAGRQAYIVYPLIDESEKLDAKAASAEFEKWRERLLPFSCELLHGRIPAPEKQATMERFRRGLTNVLVSTTVIEVGVDVPNATVMLIENAERFGLAQLHQLRGRIGRGEHKSYCILLRSDPSRETLAKLEVLEKTSNGFAVAEADWELRGPGDLLGTAQSGLPGLKLGDLRSDAKLMQRARAAAQKVLRDDPELARPENQRFRDLVVEHENFSHVS